MYARISELLLAGWLLAGAWLFAGGVDRSAPVVLDAVLAFCLAAITLVALFCTSSWPRLLNLGVAAVLAASAYLGALGGGYPAEPLSQDWLVVACLVIMLSLVPTRAWHLPRDWENVLRPPGEPEGGKGEPR